VEPVALAGLVAILLVKEAGVPIPVPGDLLVLGAGATLADDGYGALAGLALILLAGYVGGAAQFQLMRGVVRAPLLRTLERIGVKRERVEALAAWLRRRGWRGVAVSRMTPGVRVGSIAASGLTDLPLGSFVIGLVVGNTAFVSAHFALGVLLGASAGRFVGAAAASLLPVALGVVVLAVVGAVAWRLLGRRRRRAMDASIGAWADAACPACLVPVAWVGLEVGADGRTGSTVR